VNANIMVVDDETGIRELLTEILEDEGYRVQAAENATQARELRVRHKPDLVLLDIWMPDTDGITLLKEWAGSGLLSMPVVMMSGHGTIESAVEATRLGAVDYLEKPIALAKLLATVKKALKQKVAISQPTVSLDGLGQGSVMRDFKQRLTQISVYQLPLLLTGEKGCGFLPCARFLHFPDTPWVVLQDKRGLAETPLEFLEKARGGLLFLDEIGDLSKLEQKGLLQLMSRLKKYDVRLICGSSMNLVTKAESGELLSELWEQLSSLVLTIPSLRQHREDIPDIATHALSRMIDAGEVPLRYFSTGALNQLRMYDWPGNLTELDNAVRTLALTALQEEIGPEDVKRVLAERGQTAGAGSLPLDLPLREARDHFERLYFDYHLRLAQGNMTQVAQQTGLERTHLYRKLKSLGLKSGRSGEEKLLE
jgi:two-component system, NtrC family, nitrogen regulation response regulator NtrX